MKISFRNSFQSRRESVRGVREEMASEGLRTTIVVPKGLRKNQRTMGVFIEGLGVFSVDIPRGLQFGDEFDYVYQNRTPVVSRVIRIPIPPGMTPGATFKYTTPNGRHLTFTSPPD